MLYLERYPNLSKIPAEYHSSIEKLLDPFVPDYIYAMKSFRCLRQRNIDNFSIYLVFTHDHITPIGLIPMYICDLPPGTKIPRRKFITRNWKMIRCQFIDIPNIGPVFHPNYLTEGLGMIKKLLDDISKEHFIAMEMIVLDKKVYEESHWPERYKISVITQKLITRKFTSYDSYTRSLTGMDKKNFLVSFTNYQESSKHPYKLFYSYQKMVHYFTLQYEQTNLFFDHNYFELYEHLDTYFILFEVAGIIYGSMVLAKGQDNSIFCTYHVIDELPSLFSGFLTLSFLKELGTKIFYEQLRAKNLLFIDRMSSIKNNKIKNSEPTLNI